MDRNAVVSLRAKLDGADYPVEGSFAVDKISYTRDGRFSGTGRKNGIVSMTETVRVNKENGTLTLGYSFFRDSRVVASGVAVFDRGDAEGAA